MRRIVSVVGRADRLRGQLELVVSGVLLGLTVAVLLVLAVSRTTGHPISGLLTIALAILTWAIFIGADVALREGKIVHVDVVISRLPKTAQLVLQALLYLVMIAFLIALIWFGVSLLLATSGRTLPGTGLPYAYVVSAIPVGSLLMLFTMLQKGDQLLRQKKVYGPASEEVA